MSWKYFSHETDTMLACPCCGERGMNDAFMQRLDNFRANLGIPLTISSGYRCPKYNAKISSSGEDGPHTTGRAVDVVVMGIQAHELLSLAGAHGFTGIGVKQKGDHKGRFIHLDNLEQRDGFMRPWIWSY